MTTEPLPTESGRRSTAAAAAAKAKETWSDHIKAIGGLVAVTVGVIAVMIIALVAISEGTQIAGTVAGAAGGVIATIVGAYFGVKVGTDQTKDAVEGERQQAAKATVFAAHLPEGKADKVLDLAESIAYPDRAASEPAKAGERP
jgi:uncharacterized protein YacL